MRLLSVTCEATDPTGTARFWAALLGRKMVPHGGGLLVPGEGTQLGLRFVAGRAGRLGDNRMHLHLTSTDWDDQQRTVATALKLGAHHLDVGQRPEEGHVVLADPAGYEFDVIEPGNAYLAGTGFLGELACDGTRAVGLFWSAALSWPLVWDQHEEIAIQSPRGGTKIAWGGSPVPSRDERDRQRFDLAAADPVAASERLLALGATRLNDGTLADPDGTEFSLNAEPSVNFRAPGP